MVSVRERRIGILGGTFDPIHVGHLVVAEDCWFQLQLDEVLFVPAGAPPHKRGRPVSAAEDRVAMLELAIAGNSHFRLSRADVDRLGISYSVDTVRTIQAEVGPEARLFFIIGNDSLADLPSWHEPSLLLDLCQIVAVNRPGYPPFDLGRLEPVLPRARERITVLEVPSLDVAASDIRRRVAAGWPITYLVSGPVREYIAAQGLYRRRESRSVIPSLHSGQALSGSEGSASTAMSARPLE
jgi:nicotinate-nucleotide adenylyltransferase